MTYIAEVLENLKVKNPNEPEFIQTATEILNCLYVVFRKTSRISKSEDFRDLSNLKE